MSPKQHRQRHSGRQRNPPARYSPSDDQANLTHQDNDSDSNESHHNTHDSPNEDSSDNGHSSSNHNQSPQDDHSTNRNQSNEQSDPSTTENDNQGDESDNLDSDNRKSRKQHTRAKHSSDQVRTSRHNRSKRDQSKSQSTTKRQRSSSSSSSSGPRRHRSSRRRRASHRRRHSNSSTSSSSHSRHHHRKSSSKRKRSTSSSSSSDRSIARSKNKHSRSGKHHSSSYTSSSSSNTESDTNAYMMPPSFGMIVGQNVNARLRQKIQRNKFIEMAELLPEHRFKKNEELTLQLKGTRTTFTKNRPKHDLTLSQWCDAFDTYTAVYIECKSSARKIFTLVQQLLTYRKHITTLKRMGYDWLNYDRHFRKDREPTGTSHRHKRAKPCPFGTPRQDLMMTYQHTSKDLFRASNTNFRPPTTTNKFDNGKTTSNVNQTIPYGFCMSYHKRNVKCAKGPSCNYSHSCPRCNLQHPLYWQCSSSQQKGNRQRDSSQNSTFTNRNPPGPSQPKNSTNPGRPQ